MSEPGMWPVDESIVEQVRGGRTDLVRDPDVYMRWPDDPSELVQICARYGDVASLQWLLGASEKLSALGPDLGLNEAARHGHWRLCQFLIEQGADPDFALEATGETPLHSALSAPCSEDHALVVEVLLRAGADPNRTTRPGASTEASSREGRNSGETPLHRAAAHGSERIVSALIAAGANLQAVDANGDSPLSWAERHRRPAGLQRLVSPRA